MMRASRNRIAKCKDAKSDHKSLGHNRVPAALIYDTLDTDHNEIRLLTILPAMIERRFAALYPESP